MIMRKIEVMAHDACLSLIIVAIVAMPMVQSRNAASPFNYLSDAEIALQTERDGRSGSRRIGNIWAADIRSGSSKVPPFPSGSGEFRDADRSEPRKKIEEQVIKSSIPVSFDGDGNQLQISSEPANDNAVPLPPAVLQVD
jgi:hypothetical protein